MNNPMKYVFGFLLGAGVCAMIMLTRASSTPAPVDETDVPTDGTKPYTLCNYLSDNLQIDAEPSELTCKIPNYNTHGGYEGTYDTTIDIIGYVEVPKGFQETSTIPDGVGVYAIALPKTIEYEVPQHPGQVDAAPSNFIPVILIRDDVEYGVSIPGNYGAGFPYYVMNTETKEVRKPNLYALGNAKTLDEAVSLSTFRIANRDAVDYGIAEAPTNFRVNPKAK